MDAKTISVLTVVLGTVVLALYEFFTNDRHRQLQYHHASPRTVPRMENRIFNSDSNSNDRRRKKSMPRKDDDCTICWNTLQKGVVIGTACDHEFHFVCLSKMLMEHKKCPICRKPLSLDYSG